jgi:sugar phosphate permease
MELVKKVASDKWKT